MVFPENADPALREARETLIDSLGRISTFWGAGKILGQLYGLLYLSPDPLTLDEMGQALQISKGHISTTIRSLERLGMVHRSWRRGDRKDYYEAEIDFWKIARGILREREQREFDQALSTVNASLKLAEEAKAADPTDRQFYVERLRHMREFFHTLDRLVETLLALEDFRLGSLGRLGLLGGLTGRRSSGSRRDSLGDRSSDESPNDSDPDS